MIAPPGPRARGEAEALFAEAHRRRRRRRLAGGVACLVLAGSAAAGLVAAWPRHDAGTHHGHPGAVAASRGPDFTLPPVRVAWVDYSGQLHVGNLATRAQHVVAIVDGSAADPMIEAGGHLYWAAVNENVASIRDYDIATGQTRHLARGDSVFASADGRHLYIVQTVTMLIEVPADGTGAPRRVALPAGWRMSGDLGNWSVASGIIVYSSNYDQRRRPVTLAIWNPGTGHITVIGRDLDVFDTYTPPGARYSLLAWTGACRPRCLLGITNTSTLASVTVRSPSRYGFTYGGLFSSGAFSPDGKRLAVFVNTTNPQDPYSMPYSMPAIVNTRTGALRLVQAARLVTSENVGWARWLTDGTRLIVGAEGGSYAVDAVTLAARPFSFFGSAGEGLESSGDINFSATVLTDP
jgi:hypothetical protein